MNRKHYFNTMMMGALIVSVDRLFGEDPILGYITKTIFIIFLASFVYVNLRDE